MTNYEKRVASNELVPMNGMDWLMLASAVEDTIAQRYPLDEGLVETFTDMKDEIDHYYICEPEKLKQLEVLINEFKHEGPNTSGSSSEPK